MGNQANWVKAIRRGSNGFYDKYWTQLAENLVAAGLDDVVLRLGWEFNGDWYRWRSTDDPNAWRKYWARIVNAMRAVPGSNIEFDWSVALGAVRNGKTPEQAWPGPAWVDYVSVSLYDSTYGKKDCTAWTDAPSDCSTPTSRWNFLRTQPYGLNWQAAFANKCAPGTPLAFTEWAMASKESFNNGGGGDDVAFLTSFFNWVQSHPVAYEIYYNKNHTTGADDNVHEMLTYRPTRRRSRRCPRRSSTRSSRAPGRATRRCSSRAAPLRRRLRRTRSTRPAPRPSARRVRR